MGISYPNCIKTPDGPFTFNCYCLGQFRDSLISWTCTPSDFCYVSFLTEGDEVFAPLVAIVIKVVTFQSRLGLVEILHNISLLSQINEVWGGGW